MAETNMNDRKNIPKKEVKEVKEVKEPEIKNIKAEVTNEEIKEVALKYGITKEEAKELLTEASETFIKRLLSELQEKEPEIKKSEIKETEVKNPDTPLRTLFH